MDLPGLFGIARYSCFESNDFIFDPMDYGGISLVCLDGNVSALIWESVTTRAASLLQLAALVLFLSVWRLLCHSSSPLR